MLYLCILEEQFIEEGIEMSKFSNGKIWPYAIGLAITGVFALGVGTIMVTSKADIQPSDSYMTYYQDADKRANEFIVARVAFDKKYNVEYVNNGIKQPKSDVSFKVTDKNGNVVKDAKVVISVSRPETEIFNKKYDRAELKDGVYTFRDVEFQKAGKWNIIAHISVGKENRFLNIKVDTRNNKVKYFD